MQHVFVPDRCTAQLTSTYAKLVREYGIWTFTGLLHAWHLRLRRPPQQALRPLKHCHMGAQLSRAILEFILSVADRRATWLQVAERSLL